jgi:selenocysteine lyase/cysteine desulfurase
MHERGAPLFDALWNGLASIRGVTLYGSPPSDEPRTPTASFTVQGVDSRDVALRLAAQAGVFAPNGNFYAATIAERMGISPSGWVRAGCACYTTAEEVDRLVGAVRAISASG